MIFTNNWSSSSESVREYYIAGHEKQIFFWKVVFLVNIVRYLFSILCCQVQSLDLHLVHATSALTDWSPLPPLIPSLLSFSILTKYKWIVTRTFPEIAQMLTFPRTFHKREEFQILERLNIAIYKETVLWPLCICTVIIWHPMYLVQNYHTHDLR